MDRIHISENCPFNENPNYFTCSPQPYGDGQIKKDGRREVDSDFVSEGDKKIVWRLLVGL